MKRRLDRYQEIILLNALDSGGDLQENQGVQLPSGCRLPGAPNQLSPAGMWLARAIRDRGALEQQIEDYGRMMDSLKFNIQLFDECRKNWSKDAD